MPNIKQQGDRGKNIMPDSAREKADYSMCGALLEEYSAIIENVDIGIIKTCLGDGEPIEFINQAALNMIGYTREQFFEELEGDIDRCLLADSITASAEYSRIIRETDETVHLRLHMRRGDGKPLWIVGTGRAVTDENGRRLGLYTIRDLNNQLLLEEEITIFSSLLNGIVDSLEIYDFDNAYTVLYVSDGFEKLTGYTGAEVLGKKGIDAHSLFTDGCEKLWHRAERRLKERGSFNIKYDITKKNGTRIAVQHKGVLVDYAGSGKRVHCIMSDITAQREQEEALLLSEQRNRVIMDNIGEAVFDYIHETDSIINSAASSARYGLPDVIEGGCEEIIASGNIHPNSVDKFRKLYKEIIAGEPRAKELIITLDKDGKELTNEFVMVNIFDNQGKPVRAVGLMTNVSEAMALEREKSFRRAMTEGQTLTYEANITQDKIIYLDKNWKDALAISNIILYTGLVDYLATEAVHEDFADAFRNFCSPEEIKREFVSGFSHIVIEYRRKNKLCGQYIWVENRMNIIRDTISDDIKVRCFVTDITRQKEMEARLLEEQAFFDTITSSSLFTYEVDITDNKFISGHETWEVKYGMRKTNNYTELINNFTKKAVHPDEQEAFIDAYNRKNTLCQFNFGKREIYMEYRLLGDSGEFIWVSYTMHLFEDPKTGNVRGRVYIEDIDEEKKAELALIYKSEHDLLTGIFNKISVQEHINEYLSLGEGKTGSHAFFIIDIDYFKQVNDVFGHAFGDIVLSQLAGKMHELFREADLIGRVGGDEFVVFMKNVTNKRDVEAKAHELCEYCAESYTQRGVPYRITLSVGIAMYDENGNNYTELFEKADAALYTAKGRGRDRYAIYDEAMTMHSITEPEFDDEGIVASKQFEKNMSDYLLRILYESDNKENAMNTVLELIGKQYALSRVYVFEKTIGGLKCAYQWCDKGIQHMLLTSQSMAHGSDNQYESNFNSEGIYLLPHIMKADAATRKVLEAQGVKSMLQFSIEQENQFVGLVGFDECRFARMFSQEELSDLRNFSTIISVFITEMNAVRHANKMYDVTLSIINGFSSYVYICNPDTYKLVFVNDTTKNKNPNIHEGDICYEAMGRRNTPCEDCPMARLIEGGTQRIEFDRANTVENGNMMRVNASWIDWMDGRRCCLISLNDVDKQQDT